MKILITDTHFGVKQNSITWLNSQLDFIDEQLIPYLKKHKNIKLIHLGDVFDSRSSISTYVATSIVETFNRIAEVVDEIIFIGGNHDYYSPNSDEVDTLSLLFNNPKIKLITKDIYIDGKDMYVPWYQWESRNDLHELVENNNIENVFTHADIVTENPQLNCNVYSGHIHIPHIKGKIRNLGSCYALNFADANSSRGFYVLNNDVLEFIENTQSIKFYKLYNEDIFQDLSHIGINDYVELYINQTNLSTPKYNERITQLTKRQKYIWTIPQVVAIDSNGDIQFEGYDVAAITRELIPDNIKDKFEVILSSI